MKNLLLLLSLFTVMFFSSCEDENLPTEISCEGECLFIMEDIEGSMYKMNCFDTYGIQIDNPTDSEHFYIYVISDNLPESFAVQDKKVIVKGRCRTNSLKPLFYDPEFDLDMVFQAELIEIKEAL